MNTLRKTKGYPLLNAVLSRLCSITLASTILLSGCGIFKGSGEIENKETSKTGFSASEADASVEAVEAKEKKVTVVFEGFLEPLPAVAAGAQVSALTSNSSVRNKVKLASFAEEAALSGKDIGDISLKRIGKQKQLKVLSLTDLQVSPEGYAALKNLSKLETLSIQSSNLSDDDLSVLASMPSLKSLSLKGCKITNKKLDVIGALPGLRRLDLSGTLVDDAGVKILASKNLEAFGISGSKVTGDCLKSIAGMTELKVLDLSGVKINSDQFRSLTNLADLEVLNLQGFKPSSGDIETISRMKSLKYLNLPGNSETHKLKASDFKSFENLGNLVWLNLSGKSFEKPAKLEFLGFLKELRYLNLSGAKSGDQISLSITSLKKLKNLVLAECMLTDKGLKSLSEVADLECLDLSFNPDITDEGISYVSGLTKLVALKLDGNPEITEKTDQSLASLKELKLLSVDGASIHFQDLIEFDKVNPDCEVVGMLPSREHLRKLAIDPFEDWQTNFKAALSDVSLQSYSVALEKLMQCQRDLEKVRDTPAEEYGNRKFNFPNTKTILTDYAVSVVYDLKNQSKDSKKAYQKVLDSVDKLDRESRDNDTLAMVYHFLGEMEAAAICYRNAISSREGDLFYLDNDRIYRAYALNLEQSSKYVEAAKFEDKAELHKLKVESFKDKSRDNKKEIDRVTNLLESCLILREGQVEDKQKLLTSMQLVAALYSGTDKESPLWKRCKSLSKLSSETHKISYAVTRLELGESLMRDIVREGASKGRQFEEKLVKQALEEWQATCVLADKLLGAENGLSVQALQWQAECLLKRADYQKDAIQEAVAKSKRVLDIKRKLYGDSDAVLAYAKELYDTCLKRSKDN